MSDVLGIMMATLVVLITLGLLVVVLRFLAQALWPPADRAADAVLREFLTEAEYRQLRVTGYLEVASPMQPGRVYRVPRRQGRVLILDGGRPSEQLCIQPVTRDLPDADVVLMHKLLIQADEEFYLRTANHFSDPVWWLSHSGRLGPDGIHTWP
jgi:hypothetical protein